MNRRIEDHQDDDNGDRVRYDERDFEPHERRKLRQLLDQWVTSKQLWRMVGRIATVIGGVIVFMWTMREPIARVLRALGGD